MKSLTVEQFQGNYLKSKTMSASHSMKNPFFFFFPMQFYLLLIHALLYNTILKKKLKEIRNYSQYDTNATKKDTSATIQLLTD